MNMTNTERDNTATPCQHCWHLFEGPLWVVLRSGHIVQECCKCGQTRIIHRDHALHEYAR